MTEEFLALLFVSLFVSMLFMLPLIILLIIGLWKIFTKAGEEGWKAIVPIYNAITLCKIVGISSYWILIVFIGSALSSIPVIGQLLWLASSIYFGVILAVSLARSFGKSDTFAIGNYLLPVIFYPILGFGESKYLGARPMQDPVFEWIEGIFNKNTNKNPSNQQPQETNYQQPQETNYQQPQENYQQPQMGDTNTYAKYCPNCGSNVSGQDKFCPNCGNQLN